jgi:Na+/citrate or Na+/malate symporter
MHEYAPHSGYTNMMHAAKSMLLLAYAHLGRLGGARVLTRAVLMMARY